MVIRARPTKNPEKCFPEATRKDDQCDPGRARKNGHPPLTSIVHGSAACRRIPTKTEEGQKEFLPYLEFFRGRQDRNHPTYDDALLITLRIEDYDVKRVMVDGGSAAEIMYLDLYKGLKLKPEDLIPYSSPLISFDRKLVIPKGTIRLPIQISPEIVEVNFIVVDTYSPYTAIVGKDRKSTRLNSSHDELSRMPSSA